MTVSEGESKASVVHFIERQTYSFSSKDDSQVKK